MQRLPELKLPRRFIVATADSEKLFRRHEVLTSGVKKHRSNIDVICRPATIFS